MDPNEIYERFGSFQYWLLIQILLRFLLWRHTAVANMPRKPQVPPTTAPAITPMDLPDIPLSGLSDADEYVLSEYDLCVCVGGVE